MEFITGISIMATVIFISALIYIFSFPKNWKDKRFVFGVKNRDEFKEEENAKYIDELMTSCRKTALMYIIAVVALMVVLLLLPDFALKMFFWTLMVFVIFVVFVPYAKGNAELKRFKKEIGIKNTSGEKVCDLTNAGRVHALSIKKLVAPMIVSGILLVVGILGECGVFGQKLLDVMDFGGAGVIASFFIVNLILLPIAIMFDRGRNHVISKDADVNANYNRARKKAWADNNVLMAWCVTISELVLLLIMMLGADEMAVLVFSFAFTFVIMGVCLVYAARLSKIDERFKDDIDASLDIDDDDKWVLGMIYYNRDDKRLNIEKRVGYGYTVNMAHPVAKIIMGVTVILLLMTPIGLGFAGFIMHTPYSLKVDDGAVVCHQLYDNYVIELSDIKETEYIDGISDMKFVRIAGNETDNLMQGSYKVDGEKAKVFVRPDTDSCIKIVTDSCTYYVTGETREETESVYEELK